MANAFFRAGEIEAWGRGIQRVFEACREAGTPEPRIRVEPGDIWAEFPFSEAYLESLVGGERPRDGSDGTTQETTQERILALLRGDSALTRKALSDCIGISPDGIKYHLDILRRLGRIRHVGATKRGHWEVLEDGHE